MQIGTLEIQMMANMAQLQRDMADAKGAVGGAMESIQKDVAAAKTALLGLTGAIIGIGSISAFTNIITGAIETKVQLAHLATQTGSTVEALSAIGGVAKLTGTSIDDIGSAMNKLSKNLATANEDSKGAAQALAALNVNFDDFKKLSPDQQMLAVAKAMDQFADGGGKSAAALLLFGKAGAQLLPMLEELAKKNELVGKQTTESAAQAEEYTKSMKKLEAASNAWKREMVEGMLPTLSAVAVSMADARKEGNLLTSVMAGIQTLFTGNDRYKNDKAMVENTETLLNLQNALTSAKAQGYSDDSRVVKNIQAQIAGVQDLLRTTRSYRTLLDEVDDKESKKAAERASRPDLALAPPPEKIKAVKDIADAYDTIAGSISKEMAMATQELEMGRALTESERFRVATLEALDKAMQQGKLSLTQAIDLENKMHDAQLQRAAVELQLANQKIIATNNAAADKALEAGQKEIDQLISSNEQLRLNNEAIGLTTQETDKLTLARQDAAIAQAQLNLVDAQNVEGNDNRVAQLQREIVLLQQRRDLTQQSQTKTAAAKAASDAFDEWKKGWEETDKLARTVFVSWAEDGAGAAQKIGDTLKKALLSAIYEATLKPIAFQIYSQATSALGMASAAGSVGGLGNAASLAGGAGAFGSGFSSGLTAWGEGGSVTGLLGSGSSLFAGGIANGLGTLAGALGPVVLGIAALSAMFGGGGFKSSATTGETVVGLDSLGSLSYGAGPKGRTSGSDSGAAGLAKTYAATAAALGIKAGNAEFFYGGNTGAQGENPNFALSGGIVGKGGYAIGETGLNDTSLQLAASRAIFATLQKSDLPDYLGHAFDGMVAADMSKADIDAAISNAQKLKATYDANIAAQAAWQDKIDVLTGKTTQRALDLKAALNGVDAPTAQLIQSFYDLQDAQTAAKTAADALAKADAAALATMKERASWQDKLDVLLGKTTQREVSLRNDLASTTDAATKALIAQVYAQEDLAQAATDAATAADTIKSGWKSISDSLIAEINRIRGVMGGTGAGGFANAQAAFATATAQARAGDQDAAKLLPQLSANMLSLAESNSRTLLELRQYQGQTAASLGTTASILAGMANSSAGGVASAGGGGGGVVVGGGGSGGGGSGNAFSQKVRMPGGVYSDIWITDPAEIERLTTIRQYTDQTYDGSSGSLQTIAAQAMKYNVSQSELANAMGYALTDMQALFSKAGVPAFRVGTNFVPRDMLAQIHEGEAIVPRAYNPAAGGSGNGDLVAAVNSLRSELAAQRADGNVTAVATKKTYDLLRNISRDGVAMVTTT